MRNFIVSMFLLLLQQTWDVLCYEIALPLIDEDDIFFQSKYKRCRTVVATKWVTVTVLGGQRVAFAAKMSYHSPRTEYEKLPLLQTGLKILMLLNMTSPYQHTK